MLSQAKMVVAHTTVSKNSLCHSSTVGGTATTVSLDII